MAMSMKDLVAEAREQIRGVSPEAAEAAASAGDAVILDVREPAELEKDGALSAALHVPRGVLEAKADPDSGAALADLTEARGARQVQVLCASGARAALAAATLKRMGYDASVIEGGLKGWKEAGLPVD